jgi:hypothetical protein
MLEMRLRIRSTAGVTSSNFTGPLSASALALLHERGVSANELHRINNQPRRWARIGAPRYVALALAAVLKNIPPWTTRFREFGTRHQYFSLFSISRAQAASPMRDQARSPTHLFQHRDIGNHGLRNHGAGDALRPRCFAPLVGGATHPIIDALVSFQPMRREV